MTDGTPPTPKGVPLLGNGMAFSRDPFDAVEDWASRGDVVRLTFPGRSMYLVTGPDLIKEVLVERQNRFTIGREQQEIFSGIEDNALTANTGDRWRRLRRALQRAFTWDRVEEYGVRMAVVSRVSRTPRSVTRAVAGSCVIHSGDTNACSLGTAVHTNDSDSESGRFRPTGIRRE